jgi:hypothetical protein
MSDDHCKDLGTENVRGFANTDLYCRYGSRAAGP